MCFPKIVAFLKKPETKLVVFLCHHNADPDAICAAFAFSRLIAHIRPELEIEIAAAAGPSKLSKNILTAIPTELTQQPRIKEADLIVLFDTNTLRQLDEWGELVRASKSPIIVIDHHARHPETARLATVYVADEEASSTCEIIYALFKTAKIEITETAAKALFLGIAFDTRHFVLATSRTLKIVATLIDTGVDVQKTLPLLSLPMDRSERIARLRAGHRLTVSKVKEWLIVLSHVGSYQASAARALVAVGAHVAVVAGKRDDHLQVSLRSTRDFHKKTKIHLGRDIAKPLGEHLHGMGGGHAVSAGVNGRGDVEAGLKYCLSLLKKQITPLNHE
jgi:nanoRNase/pAp phosphatase (c-di-AMP/oligoRNAs hydrolase)